MVKAPPNRLRELRQRKRWSQSDVVTELTNLDPERYSGWTHTNVSKRENRHVKLEGEDISNLAKILGVTPTEILASEDGESQYIPSVGASRSDKEEQEDQDEQRDTPVLSEEELHILWMLFELNDESIAAVLKEGWRKYLKRKAAERTRTAHPPRGAKTS